MRPAAAEIAGERAAQLALVGLAGFAARSAAAVMIMPLMQKPHWAACWRR